MSATLWKCPRQNVRIGLFLRWKGFSFLSKGSVHDKLQLCGACGRRHHLPSHLCTRYFYSHCYKHLRSVSSHASGSNGSNGEDDTTQVKSSRQKTTKGERSKRLFKISPSDVNYNRKYYQNTFISATRAMSDYLLKPSDLEGLKTTAVRSAYSDAQQPPDVCYLKSDVETRAYEVWGSSEALSREIWNRKKAYEESERYRKGLGALIGHLKKTIRDHTKKKEENMYFGERTQRNMMLKGSAKVVTYAICSNCAVMLFKFGAYLYTGSATMLSESIHSLADMLNQCLLAVGILQSIKKPSPDHPYGWSRARYVYSLISGVGIFFLGAGVTVYHGVAGLINPAPLENLAMAYTILAGSFLVEGATLLLAIGQVRKSARESGMSFKEYVIRGRDPSAVTVLLEDGAAVTGVMLATGCLGLTSYTGSPVFDAMGSVIIGGLLGSFAVFLIRRNADFLIGRSIPVNRLQQIIEVLESDIVVRSLHDVKATEMGADVVRFKAEVNFDGREITRCHLNRVDMELLLEEVQKLTTVPELELFLLEHGEEVIDMLGQQVDRIEKNIKKRNPEVRHVDLEIL
ncbi:proton-coupled zinc antiporter SLC30A9, mitochondrial-like isoform X1 [Oculina patagonica]